MSKPTDLPALPSPPSPAANYIPVREAAGFLYVAGQTPHRAGDIRLRGRVGEDVSAEDARELAGEAAQNVLAVLQQHLGSLDELEMIVSLSGFVASAPDFTRHPWVVDGASDTFIEYLGERGRHARAAIGVQSLPDGAPVELSVVALRREPWRALRRGS